MQQSDQRYVEKVSHLKTEQRGVTRVARTRITVRTIVLAIVVVIIIAAVAGIAIYRDRVAPFRTTVLVVDGAMIRMDYLLKRARMAGGEPIAML